MPRAYSGAAAIALAATLAPRLVLAAQDASAQQAIETITVTAQRLNEARASIETQTGASTYVIDSAALEAAPGGANVPLNQIILQTPGAVQDSFGQLHIRGDHAGLQYRFNGVALPEGLSAFGQIMSPRLISSLKLITGVLPAEYGLHTSGVVDITTKSGTLEPGGTVSMYGGSRGTLQPSFDYGATTGAFTYFISGDYNRNDLGIESPDGSADPLHDRTTQYHGFGYFDYIFNDENRVSVVAGTSRGEFQIPNLSGVNSGGAFTVDGQSNYLSNNLDENQREITHFGIVSLQHSAGDFDMNTSFITRYSSLTYRPDVLGELLFNGIAERAYKRDVAYAVQSDAAYKIGDTHTVRGGIYVQADKALSLITAQTLPADDDGNRTSDRPITLVDNGAKRQWIESVYLQDEWKMFQGVTLNFGVRYDHLNAYVTADQVSPRVNLLLEPTDTTTIHAGFARYFNPPPFELVGSETVSKFLNTTAAPALTQDDPVKAERSNYFDAGIQQKVFGVLTLGLDGFYRRSTNLIDEGQFGAPIIQTPFNYAVGKIYGGEFTANLTIDQFQAYANLALEQARGHHIVSSQFNFDPGDLDYIANHFIDLDHEQHFTMSAGASYTYEGTHASVDMLLGSGLRASLDLPDGTSIPNGTHLPYYTQVNLGLGHTFKVSGVGAIEARFDVINLFDKVYQIRNGTGIGVGAPQFGPRRGFFGGLAFTF